MKNRNRRTLYIYHLDGQFRQRGRKYTRPIRYMHVPRTFDRIEISLKKCATAQVIYWNRIYRMKRNKEPVIPSALIIWDVGFYEEVKVHRFLLRIANTVLKILPKAWVYKEKPFPFFNC